MKYDVKIVGTSPYMQHRMDDISLAEWEKSRGMIMERPGSNWEDTKWAEYRCYRNEESNCYIPKEHIKGALIGGGGYHKAKVGGRSKSMSTIVAGMFRINPEQINMPEYDKIDKRSGVNHNVKGRVMIVRPKWSVWEAKFILDTGEDHFPDNLLQDIITSAGKYVGMGSFRTEKKGEFGSFKLDVFKALKETAKPPRK